MRDISGTAFSLKNNSTLNDSASDVSSYSPTDVFLSQGYLQSQSLPQNQSFFAGEEKVDEVKSMGLDYVLREQSAHERLIAHVLAGSDTGKMYFCRFVTKTIYKALLALQHQLSVFTRQDKVGNVN